MVTKRVTRETTKVTIGYKVRKDDAGCVDAGRGLGDGGTPVTTSKVKQTWAANAKVL